MLRLIEFLRGDEVERAKMKGLLNVQHVIFALLYLRDIGIGLGLLNVITATK